MNAARKTGLTEAYMTDRHGLWEGAGAVIACSLMTAIMLSFGSAPRERDIAETRDEGCIFIMLLNVWFLSAKH